MHATRRAWLFHSMRRVMQVRAVWRSAAGIQAINFWNGTQNDCDSKIMLCARLLLFPTVLDPFGARARRRWRHFYYLCSTWNNKIKMHLALSISERVRAKWNKNLSALSARWVLRCRQFFICIWIKWHAGNKTPIRFLFALCAKRALKCRKLRFDASYHKRHPFVPLQLVSVFINIQFFLELFKVELTSKDRSRLNYRQLN